MANVELTVGSVVTRNLGGVKMQLRVTGLTAERIICGSWEFDRATGAEIDEYLGWGPPPLATGSYLEDITGGAMTAN